MYDILTTRAFWDDLEDIALNLEAYAGIPDAAEKLLLEIERLAPGLREFPRRYRKHIWPELYAARRISRNEYKG